MLLSEIPFNELVDRLFEIHQSRLQHFSKDELNSFQESLYKDLILEIETKKQFKILKNELSQAIKTLEDAGINEDLTAAELMHSDRVKIEHALRGADLMSIEISKKNDVSILSQMSLRRGTNLPFGL